MEKYTKLTYKNKNLYLIGTAHVSKESVNQVHEVIEEIKPDTICVELDKGRYDSIMNPDAYKQMDIIKIIKEKRTAMMLVNLILSAYQKRMATKLEVKSGDEMRAGIQEAHDRKLELVLADRNIQTTFMRVWRKHKFIEKIKLVFGIFSAAFDDEEVSEEDLAKLKESDMLSAALSEISEAFPTFAEALIFERDAYLAYKIKNAKGVNIVAVVGAAHVPGIIKNLDLDQDIKELDTIPPKSFFSKIIGWIIPALIIALIVLSFSIDKELGFSQIKSWFLWNGTLSAIGTALVLGHPLSIITAFVASPFTSLNPLIAAGWFAGLVEAYVRKPRVIDLENLTDDMHSIKSMLHNRVIRIILVVVMANVFSTLGTYISGVDIISSLFGNL